VSDLKREQIQVRSKATNITPNSMDSIPPIRPPLVVQLLARHQSSTNLSSEFGSNILFFDILICIMILRWSSVFMDANKSNQIKGERFAPWGK
jgi:hypothetical protein